MWSQELYEQRAVVVLEDCHSLVSPIMDFLHEVSRYREMAQSFREKMCDSIKEGLPVGIASASASAGSSAIEAEATAKRART